MTSPPYNLGIRYNRYQDTLSPAEYLEWTDSLDGRGRARAAARRLAVPERRREAERPVDGARRRAGGAIRTCGCRTSSTGSSRSRSSAARPARPPGSTRDLAVGHYKPINSDRFLNDCHEFIFHFTPHGATRARSAGARRALSGSVEHRAAGAARRTASAAAATRGSSRTRRFSGAIAIGRIRRRSRRSCPSSACACTGCRGSSWRWIRSPASAARPSRARGSASNFIGADIDETYLDEAVDADADAASNARAPSARRHCEGARAAAARSAEAQLRR